MRWVPWFLYYVIRQGARIRIDDGRTTAREADLGPDFSGAVMHGLQWPVWIHHLGEWCVAQADFADLCRAGDGGSFSGELVLRRGTLNEFDVQW